MLENPLSKRTLVSSQRLLFAVEDSSWKPREKTSSSLFFNKIVTKILALFLKSTTKLFWKGRSINTHRHFHLKEINSNNYENFEQLRKLENIENFSVKPVQAIYENARFD